MSLLEIDDVTVRFGSRRDAVTAIDGVSVAVDEGRTLGIVGESGSGKSTTARVALGLCAPTSGDVRFAGAPVKRRQPGSMQAVFQHPLWALNPRLSVAASVAEPLRVQINDRRAISARVDEMLAAVALPASVGGRRPHELSGGQRQRVAIARALVTNPRFVVFDEAVSALDVSVQAQILQLIVRLQAEHRFGALFISHDLAVVRFIADEICVMRAGRVVEHSTTAAFVAGPTDPYSRTLMEDS